MNFASDNCAGAHEKISEAIAKQASGFASSYGSSDLDRKVEKTFSEIFECDIAVYFVATGTAANSLALAATNKPGGVALCHSEAHVIEDECGAPEFFTGGGRLAPVDGKNGKISEKNLKAEFKRFVPGFVHHGRPMATTITQATEIGTLYSLDEIARIAEISHQNDVPLHMDGARFANALAGLGVSPAEMTWKQGVDFLSFGGTKNGCWCAEALLCFDMKLTEEVAFLRKRAGQLFSKSRFIAAQFDAYFENGLWLQLASHANEMTRHLAARIDASSNIRLAWKPEANEVFAIMKKPIAEKLRSKGVVFFEWNHPRDFVHDIGDDEDLYRFVTSFATAEDDIEKFNSLINQSL